MYLIMIYTNAIVNSVLIKPINDAVWIIKYNFFKNTILFRLKMRFNKTNSILGKNM
jgi:hypothetical protein